jgi:hypothetical protein
VTRSADEHEILAEVLDQWRAAVDTHEPERVAAVFTEDDSPRRAFGAGTVPSSVSRVRWFGQQIVDHLAPSLRKGLCDRLTHR